MLNYSVAELRIFKLLDAKLKQGCANDVHNPVKSDKIELILVVRPTQLYDFIDQFSGTHRQMSGMN